MRRWLAGVITGCMVISMAPDVSAADARRASLTRVDAGTLVRVGGRGQWVAARRGMLVGTGDEIKTARGMAELTYGDGTVTRVGPNSTLGLKDAQTRGVRLWFGQLWMKVAKGSGGMQIRTPAAVAAVTGTDLFVYHQAKTGKQAFKPVIASAGNFRLAADDKVSTIGLLEGGVAVKMSKESFDSAMRTNPRAGILFVASTDLKGFPIAQDAGFQNVGVGERFDTDGNTFNMGPVSFDDVTSFNTNMGTNFTPPAGQGGNGGGQGGQGGKSGGNGGQGGSGGGSGGQGGQGGSGGGSGGAGNTPGGMPGGGTNNNGGNSQPGGGTTPPPPGGNNQPPAGDNNPPPPGDNNQQPTTPDPTQQTQENLIRPVDRSPASGELEIIIQ